MEKKVACEFEGCEARIEVENFDEAVWLPVFKATREHVGFFCPRHVREIRDGLHAGRYLLSRTEDGDELIIDREPLPPPG